MREILTKRNYVLLEVASALQRRGSSETSDASRRWICCSRSDYLKVDSRRKANSIVPSDPVQPAIHWWIGAVRA